MLLLHEPSPADIKRWVQRVRTEAFTGPGDLLVRVDNGESPEGWIVDQCEAVIGTGQADFAAGRAAIMALVPIRQPWITVHAPDTFALDAPVGVQIQLGPLWSVNWARITDIVDEPEVFSFSYTTTRSHGERGEERFEVRHNDDDTVSWHLLAVSQPGQWYTMIAKPIVRLLQARFRAGSIEAMRAAVQAAGQAQLSRT
jgi:uncharacterized protein (UPF0548 family)